MKKILKEPFVHFLFFGAVLFLIYGMVNKNSLSKNTIILNDFDVENLISTWKMQWKRPPTEQELQKLIELNIKQEIFYQEALKMNLDHNDEIIKRRLSKKMESLSNDVAAMIEPTDEELKKYFKENSDKYLLPTSYSLYQITFSPDKRKNNFKDAKTILEKFPNATFDEMKQWGDTRPISYFFEDINTDELGSQLGRKFSDALQKQEINKWVGPIPSGFGYHLVYITKKENPGIPEFESVKKVVLRDYEYYIQQNINEQIYGKLKKNYTIHLDIKSKDFNPNYIKYLESEFNK